MFVEKPIEEALETRSGVIADINKNIKYLTKKLKLDKKWQ